MAFQMLHISDLSQAVDRTQNGKQSGRSWPSKPASITQSHFNHCTSKQPSCYRNIVWGNASHWPLIKSSHQSAALILSHGLGSVKQCLHQRPAKSSQCQPVRWGTDLLKHYAKQLSLIDVCWRLPDVAFSLPMSRRLHDIASLSPPPPFFFNNFTVQFYQLPCVLKRLHNVTSPEKCVLKSTWCSPPPPFFFLTTLLSNSTNSPVC